ncbi:HD-GYP domain-containing protein [Halobacteriovorax sp. HLS]|uniref:HD-GYP domain-containing protein n=1 Tax=Halobacteriovorax sp. HLS TaxID=2234000 RepID=UPI000FD831B9|nr:HD domain-containing phosphohydrolase [Halobacteriovorax sp. HLS]
MSKAEQSHVAVPLSKFYPDVVLCCDIYLLINQKFIKYKNTGEVISAAKYDQFLSSDIQEIYILIKDIEIFMEWLKTKKEESVQETIQKVGVENTELALAREEMKETVYQVFAGKKMDAALVEHLQNNVESFINKAKNLDESKVVLAKLTKRSQTIADHSVNTANLSIYLAMVLGHGEPEKLRTIYMSALLHDYGKVKIPDNVLENPQSNLYKQAMEFHPIKGASAIREMSFINSEVASIVEQHHEQFNGKGYPHGLKGEEISVFSQLISLANIFDNSCTENSQKSEKEMFKMAIKVIEYDRGKNFNPEMVERCTDGLKLVHIL